MPRSSRAFVQSSLCASRPRILYVGPSGSGTQINLYYPNDYAGGTNTEPFGMCGSLGNATFTLQPKAGFGSAMTKAVPLAASRPGIFHDFSAANTPAGVHLNAFTGTQTSIASCNANPALCPVSTGGQMNYLIVFTTGAEKYGCPTPTTSCTPPLSGLSFTLGPVGGPDVAQQLTFLGWVGFLGQEQANVRLAAGTTAGEKRLKVTGSSQALIVRLGAAS